MMTLYFGFNTITLFFTYESNPYITLNHPFSQNFIKIKCGSWESINFYKIPFFFPRRHQFFNLNMYIFNFHFFLQVSGINLCMGFHASGLPENIVQVQDEIQLVLLAHFVVYNSIYNKSE